MGELYARTYGPTPKQTEIFRQTERTELLTRLGELAHRSDSNDKSPQQIITELNQKLNDLDIAPNSYKSNVFTSNYGAKNNNHYGPGNNNTSNGQAPPNRRISNYTIPYIPGYKVCEAFMDGIKHASMNQPCDIITSSGNLSLDKLSSLADKDGSVAVDIIKSISLDGNLA